MRRVALLLFLAACGNPTSAPTPPPPDLRAPQWPVGARLSVTITTADSATLEWPKAKDDASDAAEYDFPDNYPMIAGGPWGDS